MVMCSRRPCRADLWRIRASLVLQASSRRTLPLVIICRYFGRAFALRRKRDHVALPRRRALIIELLVVCGHAARLFVIAVRSGLLRRTCLCSLVLFVLAASWARVGVSDSILSVLVAVGLHDSPVLGWDLAEEILIGTGFDALHHHVLQTLPS